MVIITLQQITDERISFLKEQINHENKLEVSKSFQRQIAVGHNLSFENGRFEDGRRLEKK